MVTLFRFSSPMKRPKYYEPDLSPSLSIYFTLCMWMMMMMMMIHVAEAAVVVGVNWGNEASHPLPAASSMLKILEANGVGRVKLMDANTSILNSLAGTNIEVMLGLPNDLLLAMTYQAQAKAWVRDNVVRYMYTNGVNIKYVAVGNEPFLKSYNGAYLNVTYSALVNIQKALAAVNLGERVKATVPMNADVIQAGTVPSGSIFRPDLSNVMSQIVIWLNQNDAPFTINIYPFLSLYNDKHFPVDYAFFDGAKSPVIDGPYTYRNVFEASYDSLLVALAAVGPSYAAMNIIVGEVGWPTDGDVNANLYYAKKFNQGFLNHVAQNRGTPRQPNTGIHFYLSSLIDEDMKSIAPGNFERHWGVFGYDGKPKYNLSLTGSNGPNLVQAPGVQYMTEQWCVYNPDSGDQSSVAATMAYACQNSDCTALGYGSSCNPFLDAAGNVSYAFNSYFQRQNQGLGTCSFNGLGKVVTRDPSIQNCKFMVQIAASSYLDSGAVAGAFETWGSLKAHLVSSAFMLFVTHFLLHQTI